MAGWRGLTWLWTLPVVAGLSFGACGGGSGQSGATSSAPVSTSASDSSSQQLAAAGTSAPNEINEIATDNKFSLTNIPIKAGESYTLVLTNKGQAVHNWRINDAKGPDGKDVAAALVDANKSSKVSFAIAKAGTYHFVCDVHPDEMKGTLTVQ